MSLDTIEHNILKQLAGTGHIKKATAVANGDSWSLVFKIGSVLKTLKARDSKNVRAFRKLETLGKYLGELGIQHYEVDQSNYDSSQRSRRRPDKAQVLKNAHQAAAYDKWFKAEVQASLDDIKNGTDDPQGHDEFFNELEANFDKRHGQTDK